MKNVLLPNGIVGSVEDSETITAKPHTAKGGLKKNIAENQIDKIGLQIASDYFNQALYNISKAKQIIDKLLTNMEE